VSSVPEPSGLTLLNFSHPLTAAQVAQVTALTGERVERVIDVPTQFDLALPFGEQVGALVDSIGLSSVQWQTLPLVVNPPSLNWIAVTLLAHLHGRMGHFPTMLRLRPVVGSVPPRFEVAEMVHLQAVRDEARMTRVVGV